MKNLLPEYSLQRVLPKYLNQQINRRDKAFLLKIIQSILENTARDNFTASEVITDSNMSKSGFYKSVKRITGFTAGEFIKKIQLDLAAQLIKEGDYTISQIITITGFNDPSYFYKKFKKEYGLAPLKYLDKMED